MTTAVLSYTVYDGSCGCGTWRAAGRRPQRSECPACGIVLWWRPVGRALREQRAMLHTLRGFQPGAAGLGRGAE